MKKIEFDDDFRLLNSQENTIADPKFLKETLGFSEELPKIWLKKI